MAQNKVAFVTFFLVAVLVVSATIPTANAYGCYDDCFGTCTNGNDASPAAATCKIMCNEACAVKGLVDNAVGAAGAIKP